MRRALALAVLAVPGFALGQDLQIARNMMDGAMAELASHSQLTLVLDGVETDGQVQHSFNAVVAVSFAAFSQRQIPRLELLGYRDNRLITRSAADGERFWNYDLNDREYTSTEYGTNAFVGKERDRLFQNVLLRSKAEQTFIAKLLKDAFLNGSGSRSAWLPWRPSANVQVTGTDILCQSTLPSLNRLTYSLQADQGFGYALNTASYYEETRISGRVRTTQWNMTVLRDQLPQGTSFVFIPPAGARAIAVDEARGGGL